MPPPPCLPLLNPIPTRNKKNPLPPALSPSEIETHAHQWSGTCWYVHDLLRYEFAFEFETPATYPATAPEIRIPALDGKTAKMYRGGAICLTLHFKPLWGKNAPHFGVAHALCLGLAPWLAAEVRLLEVFFSVFFFFFFFFFSWKILGGEGEREGEREKEKERERKEKREGERRSSLGRLSFPLLEQKNTCAQKKLQVPHLVAEGVVQPKG